MEKLQEMPSDIKEKILNLAKKDFKDWKEIIQNVAEKRDFRGVILEKIRQKPKLKIELNVDDKESGEMFQKYIESGIMGRANIYPSVDLSRFPEAFKIGF